MVPNRQPRIDTRNITGIQAGKYRKFSFLKGQCSNKAITFFKEKESENQEIFVGENKQSKVVNAAV